ncbi:hypothetical protein D3C76_1779480 [compost metagenome]
MELCDAQRHIVYSDNIYQHLERMCPPDCDASISEHKITVGEWEEKRKTVVSYGKQFDEIYEKVAEQIIVKIP